MNLNSDGIVLSISLNERLLIEQKFLIFKVLAVICKRGKTLFFHE